MSGFFFSGVASPSDYIVETRTFCLLSLEYALRIVRGATVRCTRWIPDVSRRPKYQQWSLDQSPSIFSLLCVFFLLVQFGVFFMLL